MTESELHALHSLETQLKLARETANEAMELATRVITRGGCTCYTDAVERMQSKLERINSNDPWENGSLGCDERYVAPAEPEILKNWPQG